MSIPAALCVRCRHVLVDEDDQGWYYQTPVEMDRVHQCGGKPHLVIAPENSSPCCDACDLPESHTFHDLDKRGKFSGYHAFKATP